MNKNNLCFRVAEYTELPVETVEAVLNSLEDVVIQTLERGDQLHWGGFFRAWTVRKRPTAAAGKPIHPDTSNSKIRYLMPCCAFGAKVVQPMKQRKFNCAKKNESKKRIKAKSTRNPPTMVKDEMDTQHELAMKTSL